MAWKVLFCSICLGTISFYLLPQTSTTKTGTQVAQKDVGSNSSGCSKRLSRDAIDKATSKARERPDGSLVIFDFQGNLRGEEPLKNPNAKAAAKKKCNDLQPISDNCWVCCSTGEIICKTGKSKLRYGGIK